MNKTEKKELKKKIQNTLNLKKHRQNILNFGEDAYTMDISRCYKSVIPHLKKAGYQKVTWKRCPDLLTKYVDLIFKCQDSRPFFHIHIENCLPFCWNSPAKKGWDLNYIKYEWGHINSINQNNDLAHSENNLCLQSARCNQHIQSSLNVDELIQYGGELEVVIRKNLSNREKLFASNEWQELLKCLDLFR